jgi:hypothetical protein
VIKRLKPASKEGFAREGEGDRKAIHLALPADCDALNKSYQEEVLLGG